MTMAPGRGTGSRVIDPDAKKMWAIAASAGAVGIEIAAAIALGYFGGAWLDSKFHSTPWLKWIGFCAGVGAAIKALMRVVRTYNKSLDSNKDPEPPK